MKLIFTALIDFNRSHDSNQNVSEKSVTNETLTLVHVDSLLDKIAVANGGNWPTRDDYTKNVLPAVLKFNDLTFRQRYLEWINTNYAHSMVNQRRVRRIEREVIIKWAEEFNHRHYHLKIVKVTPEVTDQILGAKLQIIGYGKHLNHHTFDFQNALSLEYNQDYRRAFYKFESHESHQLAFDFESVFNRYIPGANFHFFDRTSDHSVIYNVQPLRFNRLWIKKQETRSVSNVSHKLVKVQSAYQSASSQAQSLSNEGSQLRNQIASAASTQSSLTAQLSDQNQANASLSAENISLKSNVASLSRSAETSTSENDLASKLASQVQVNKKLRTQINSVTAQRSAANPSSSAIQKVMSVSRSRINSMSNASASMYVSRLSQAVSSANQAKVTQISRASSATSRAVRQVTSMNRQMQSLRSQATNRSNALKIFNSSAFQSAAEYQESLNDSGVASDAQTESNSSKSTKNHPSGKAFYIPVIIIISIIILILLIFVFPLFRF